MAGKSTLTADAAAQAALRGLSKSEHRGEADRARAILLTLEGRKAEENAIQHLTCRTQSRESVSQTLERVRTAARLCRHYPRWEPDAGKPHVRFCAGGPG